MLILIILGIFFLALGGGWLIFASPLFRIQKIEIIGAKTVSEADITGLIRSSIATGPWWNRFLGSENILAWPDAIGGSDLSSYPVIQVIHISKSYLYREVFLRVEERTPRGVWCYEQSRTVADSTRTGADSEIPSLLSGPIQQLSASVPRLSASSCWWFDETGFIFKRSPATAGGLILSVRDFSQEQRGLNSKILPERLIKNFFSVFTILQKSSVGVREILLKDISREEVEVLTAKGPRLYFSLRFPPEGLYDALENFYAKPAVKKFEYIDFRVENKAYYK